VPRFASWRATRFARKPWSVASRPFASSSPTSRRTSPARCDTRCWREQKHPTRFVHVFVFRDAEADRIHSESAAVKRFAGILHPECLAPVEFTDYDFVAANV